MGNPHPYPNTTAPSGGVERAGNDVFSPLKRPQIDSQATGYNDLRDHITTKGKIQQYPNTTLSSSTLLETSSFTPVSDATQEKNTVQTADCRDGKDEFCSSRYSPLRTLLVRNTQHSVEFVYTHLDDDVHVQDGRPADLLGTFFIKHEVESQPHHDDTCTEHDPTPLQSKITAHPAPRSQSPGLCRLSHDGRIIVGQVRTTHENSIPLLTGLPYQTRQYQTASQPQYQRQPRLILHPTTPSVWVDTNVQTPYQFARAAKDGLLRTMELEHEITGNCVEKPITLNDDDTSCCSSSPDIFGDACSHPLTPFAVHSPSRSCSPATSHISTDLEIDQEKAMKTKEETAEQVEKQARIEAVVDAEKKLYDDNKNMIEKFCSTKQEYIKAKWFIKLHAWKKATGRMVTTKMTIPDVQNVEGLSGSTLTPGQPDTIVQDAIANGKRPDVIRHPQDKVRVPEYPTDDDIETCAFTEAGKYRCTHEFGKFRCCTEGLDRAGKLSSINKQINTWRAKVERLIQKRELHASHKTWDRCYDSELRKKELEALEEAKRIARAAEVARFQAQTSTQQADTVTATPYSSVIVADLVSTPAVEPMMNSPPLQVNSRRASPESESVMNFQRQHPAPELHKGPRLMKWLNGSVFDLDVYLANPWPLDNDYDRFLVQEPAAIERMTKSFLEYFHGQNPAKPSAANRGKRDLDAFLADNKPVTGGVNKRQKISQPNVVHLVKDLYSKPAGEEASGDRKLIRATPHKAQDHKPILSFIDIATASTAEQPTIKAALPAQQMLDPRLVKRLKQHDILYSDALCREKRKKWPNFELLKAWWSASRRKVQGLSLMPEELKLLQRAEPSWDPDKRPTSEINSTMRETMAGPAPDHYQAEQGIIEEDGLDSLFDDEADEGSLFGDEDG